MSSNLFEGDFELPALHEVLQDLNWGQQEVRTQQGLGGELALGVTDQHLPYWEGRFARVVPNCRLGNEFHVPLGFTVPTGQPNPLPARV